MTSLYFMYVCGKNGKTSPFSKRYLSRLEEIFTAQYVLVQSKGKSFFANVFLFQWDIFCNEGLILYMKVQWCTSNYAADGINKTVLVLIYYFAKK